MIAGIPANGPKQRTIPAMPQIKLAIAKPEREAVGPATGGSEGGLMKEAQ